MKYKIFGRQSGLRVSELALGTGQFGTALRGYGAEREEARRIFDGYAEAGGNFIDTADAYQAGQSETFVGEFIASERDHFVVSSKYTLGAERGGGISRTGNSRKNMVRSVAASLARLKTDRIDLYWVHMPDDVTPVEEILRGLDDLVRAGKILYFGLSDFPAWRVARAATIAELRGWTPLIGLQIEYSLAERTPDRELLPAAEALGLGTTLWSPLGGGFLTGKYRQGVAGRLTLGSGMVHQESTSQNSSILDAVTAIAREVEASAAQVALAWVRQKSARLATTAVPILGVRTRAQLDDNLGTLKLKLDAEQLARLDEVSAVPLGFPHDMRTLGPGVKVAIAGGDRERLELPRIPVA
jgi:aryl-alcohol dehydrogenase-like predicted oxidoreductase